jgi:PAS domain S-box-containing protein
VDPMSPTTAACFLSLVMGILYARLERREGWLGLFYTRGPERLMARGLVPAAIIAPILFGWLGRLAFRAGLRGTIMPLSLVVSGMIVLLLIIILLNARAMWRSDIKRREAERALAERERMQSAVLENAGAGILVLDAEGNSVTSNKTLQAMLGLNEGDISRMPFWNVTHQNEMEANRRLFHELVSGDRDNYFIATRCMRKDGTPFWAEMHTSVARDGTGRTEFVIAMLQDVSERREAEEARQRLTDIVEATPDFVGVVDAAKRILYVNEAGRNMVGMRTEDLARSSISDFHPPDAAERVMNEGIPAAIKDGVWSGESKLKGRDGAVIPVSQVVVAHKRQNGELAYLSTVMRDITDRKRLELAQQFLLDVSRASSRSMNSDEILRSLVKLVVPRHADYCAIHLLTANGMIERSAIARCKGQGHPVTDVLRVYPENRQPAPLIREVAQSREAIALRQVKSSDLARLVRGTGHPGMLKKLRLKSLMVLPLEGRERVLGVICYVRSVTNQPFEGHRVALAREMAERIALSLDNAQLLERAQEATRIRDEVLRVVAHDLRNPLSTISLTADFIHIKLATLTQQPWMDKLDIIVRSVEHADRLIQDLLDVARMQTGGLTLDMQPTIVDQLVDEVMQMHQPMAEARGLRLRSDIMRDAGLVFTDAERVMRVFSNLIGNALKFSPRGTEITLRARRLDGKMCFSISDQGRGIPEHDQSHLFDPFWQEHKGNGGVGLGLSIARAIVQAHGGRIWVESKPGHGATFFFTLPIARAQRITEVAAD